MPNAVTIVLGIVILGVFVFAAYSVYKSMKKGDCGSGCAGCNKDCCNPKDSKK